METLNFLSQEYFRFNDLQELLKFQADGKSTEGLEPTYEFEKGGINIIVHQVDALLNNSAGNLSEKFSLIDGYPVRKLSIESFKGKEEFMRHNSKDSKPVHYIFNYTYNITSESKDKIFNVIESLGKDNTSSTSPTVFFHFTIKNISELDKLENIAQEKLNWFLLVPIEENKDRGFKKIDHYYSVQKNDKWAIDRGYVLLGVCCYVYPMDKKLDSDLIPLFHYYSSRLNDSFYCTKPGNEATERNGYELKSKEKEAVCQVNRKEGDGRVQFRRYWARDFFDHLYFTAPNEKNLAHSYYKREGNEGYVYVEQRQGLIPLYVYSTAPNIYFGELFALPGTLTLNSSILSEIERKEDLLNYSSYATAIVELIRKNNRNTPFNIGIIGPWGHGKTKLMELIKAKFDEEEKDRTEIPSRGKATFKDMLNWAKHKDLEVRTFSGFYPTVWFNPWKYQSSEQIWAGMGHAIITQLIEKKKNPVEREKLWLRLRLKRIDLIKLRSDLQNYLIGKGLHFFIDIFILILILIGLIFVFPFFSQEAPYLLIPAFYEGISWFKRFRDRKEKLQSEVEGKYLQYLQEPKYEENLGNYHYLTDGLEKVFELLISEKPVVVFIDDLDRCSPKVVAEVFEAINLIMNNPAIKEKCYFILGFDAHIVASALDESYSSFNGQFSGWYFLDKFIQMPFYIPIMSQEEKNHFVSSFFRKEVLAQSLPDEANRKKEEILKEEFENAQQKGGDVAVKQIFQEKRNIEEHRILSEIFVQNDIQKNKDDSPEILEQLQYLMIYLNQSPRDLKRYINLLRFHNAHQKARDLEGKTSSVDDFTRISKWLLITLKWHRLVRWLQWEHCSYVTFQNPLERSKFIELLLDRYIKSHNLSVPFDSYENINEVYDKWCCHLSTEDSLGELTFLRDKQLLMLFLGEAENNFLSKAIECKVW